MDFEDEDNAYLEVGDNRNVKCRHQNNHNKRTNQRESYLRNCNIQKRQEQGYKDKLQINDQENEKQLRKLQQQEKKLKMIEKRIQKQIDIQKDNEKMQPKKKQKVNHQLAIREQ
ncbi:unnamed protein product [Paramecium pentaurelia]|uniref:Uncharacterized protein n=1 Tax=Paramecium pentaurelia TaxID=43138 RepID=A0A8S1X291_9CILI|nr:unnamed protein product [Paramecium pentaurelia]